MLAKRVRVQAANVDLFAERDTHLKELQTQWFKARYAVSQFDLIIAFGGLWPEVRLAASTRTLAMRLGLVAAWFGVLLNVYAAVVNLPGPATAPGVQPAVAWQAFVFNAGLEQRNDLAPE